MRYCLIKTHRIESLLCFGTALFLRQETDLFGWHIEYDGSKFSYDRTIMDTMVDHRLTAAQIEALAPYLKAEERSPGTIEKYTRDVNAFAVWLGARPVTRETAIGWKEHLLTEG